MDTIVQILPQENCLYQGIVTYTEVLLRPEQIMRSFLKAVKSR